MSLSKNKKSKKDQVLEKQKKKLNKQDPKFKIKKRMKKRIKNSQIFSNVKNVAEDGLIELRTGDVASLIEVQAIDLSLTSKSEKQNFFYALKSLYQIKGLNLKCYKLDQKINLNNNKINLTDKMEYFKDDNSKYKLLEESKRLIEELEENHYTISSVYYLVVIAKDALAGKSYTPKKVEVKEEKKVAAKKETTTKKVAEKETTKKTTTKKATKKDAE